MSAAPRPGHTGEAVGDEPADEVAELKSALRESKAENTRLRQLLADNGIELGNGYQSIMEILEELPADLKAAKAWDSDQVDSVKQWLSEHPVGRTFQAPLQVEKVTVIKRPGNTSSPANRFTVLIVFQNREYKFRGLAFSQAVGDSWPQPLKLVGDEQLARSADRLKVGQRITVKGKIHSIHLGPELSNRRQVHIGLSEIDVKLPGG